MLDDLLIPNLRLVVCGTAAGRRSAELKQYYAGRGNKFWRVLAEVGLTPHVLLPSEYRHLSRYGIGLTDVAKGQSGSDSEIDFGRADPMAVHIKIQAITPRVLAFNGKKAAQTFFGVKSIEFGLHRERVGDTLLFVVPSTSGAANASWDIEQWRALAELAG